MRRRDTSLGGEARSFPSTIWSMVVGAADSAHPARRDCLERLVRLYWKPAYFYLRDASRLGVEDAKDLTQEFFTRILEKSQLGRLQQERGSFRGFLKQALKNFAIDAHRRQKARRPPSGVLLVPFEEWREADLSGRVSGDPASAFDREWRDILLQASVKELEQRMKKEGHEIYFDVFRSCCLPEKAGPAGRRATYREIAERHGLRESDVRNHLSRCRKELRTLVREKIRDYVFDERDVEAEFREMIEG